MHEDLKQRVYFNLAHQAELQTRLTEDSDRLAGTFAQAIFQALQADLTHQEMIAALTIGHHYGCKKNGASASYEFLCAQLDYWAAVHTEAEQFWLRRYRGDEE